MKKVLLLFVVVLCASTLWSQFSTVSSQGGRKTNAIDYRIPLIGEVAPSFIAESTSGTVNFPDDYAGEWTVLFSHPQDFTPVCSTEIIDLANLQGEFDKLGVKLVVVSADHLFVHKQWKNALEMLTYKNNKKVKIKFPIVDDENVVISREYGMLNAVYNSTRSVRGVIIVDSNNIIKALYFYPMSVGRSAEELIRVVNALQATARDNVFTPVNWTVCNDVLLSYLPNTENNSEVDASKYYNEAWFLWYKKYNK